MRAWITDCHLEYDWDNDNTWTITYMNEEQDTIWEETLVIPAVFTVRSYYTFKTGGMIWLDLCNKIDLDRLIVEWSL